MGNESQSQPQREKIMKKTILLIGLMLGFVLFHMGSVHLSAYSEKNGGWTATEKRQVINLLEKIAENTRR